MPEMRLGAILPSDPLWAAGQPEPLPPKKKRRKKRKKAPSKINRAQGHLFYARLRRARTAERKWIEQGLLVEAQKQRIISDMFEAGATWKQMERYFKVGTNTVARWRRAHLGRSPWPRLVLFEQNRPYNEFLDAFDGAFTKEG